MADTARARKVAERIKDVVAANLVQVVKNPDLGFVTITDVRVTGDLQQASVFYTALGEETQTPQGQHWPPAQPRREAAGNPADPDARVHPRRPSGLGGAHGAVAS